jgi:fructose-1,6-bisphosphatase/inositol monophosphatase family enzyme
MASLAEGSGGQNVTHSVVPPGDISLAEYLKFTAEALKVQTHSYWAPTEEIREGFPEYLDVEPFHAERNAHSGSDWCQELNVSFSRYGGWIGEVASWYRDHYRGPDSWGYQERPREVVYARSKGRLSRDAGERLSFAVTACEAAGAMLKRARSLDAIQPEDHGQQLKSPFDRASGEILRLLIEEVYPEDAMICEDLVPRLTQRRSSTAEGEPSIWIVDPLDGTRSYHGGFSGYCVQMAHSRQGQLLIGVVHVPEEDSTYWAVAGFGSFRRAGRHIDQIVTRELPGLGTRVFTDSRPPGRTERRWFDELGASRFLECGSYGVKLCRIAEGQADFLIKRVGCEIWDVAAGALILVEAGGWLTGWNFTTPDFSCRQTSLQGLVAMGSDSAEIRERVRRQVFESPQMGPSS